MIGDYGGGGGLGWGLAAGAGVSGVIVTKCVDFFMRRRRERAEEAAAVAGAEAARQLIEQYAQRTTALETRQADLERRIAEEINLRLQEQEKVSRLRQRVRHLVSVLRQHAIDIPPEHENDEAEA